MSIPKKLFSLFISILSFLFIYAVNIKGLPNFSYIGIILIPFLAIFYPKPQSIYQVMTAKPVLIIIAFYVSFLLFSIAYATFGNTYDYSLSKTILHTVASVPACISIAVFLFNTNRNNNAIETIYKYFRFILYLQVFFILVMLIFPNISILINSIVKSESQIERMSEYLGARGLGVSGSIAFGLATTLAMLLYIVFFLRVIINNKLTLIDYVMFIIASIASLSAGRTAIAGSLMFIVSYLFILYKNNQWSSINKLIFLLPSFIVFASLLMLMLDIESVSTYIFYVFQPIQNYLDYGTFKVSSLQGLEDMYFLPSDTTLLAGDARYENPEGAGYYMAVDAGFMRFLLFFGLPLSIILYFSWFCLFYFNYLMTKKIIPYSFVLFLSLLMLSIIFHYKGEFIYVAVSFNKILIILLAYLFLIKRARYLLYGLHD